jgi:hypothetical protein
MAKKICPVDLSGIKHEERGLFVFGGIVDPAGGRLSFHLGNERGSESAEP